MRKRAFQTCYKINVRFKILNSNSRKFVCVFSVLQSPSFVSIVPIKVTGMFADPAWLGHPETTIDKAFDGSDSWSYQQCYVAHSNRGARARIDIQPSIVRQIKILNRGDCCGTLSFESKVFTE